MSASTYFNKNTKYNIFFVAAECNVRHVHLGAITSTAWIVNDTFLNF